MILNDKVAVLVGGSRGFGKVLAKALIREGAKVVIVSKNPEILNKTAEEIGATAFAADVRSEKGLKGVADKVVAKFGQIDLWVNGAGLFRTFPQDKLLDAESVHELFDVNFYGAAFGSRAAMSSMREKGGAIVNILSSAALDATRAVDAEFYAASKWALRGYTEALRGTNSSPDIKIYGVYPGGMKTALHDEALPADFSDFMEPGYVVEKVVANLKQENPEIDLIIKRPKAQ
jgi:NAD(P)-dependent dehydrogenase (short-subunit alcohol dehydrogenase family)